MNEKSWPSVTFASGCTSGQSAVYEVIDSARYDACFLILQECCFHPRDFRWPDQPADRGQIFWANGDKKLNATVQDVVKMLRAPDISDLFDTDIGYTKRDMPEGARLLTALKLKRHYFDLLQGALVSQAVIHCEADSQYRQALSVGHSLGHLASYALNQLTKDYWRKPVQQDARGNPDFIALSQIDSKVFEYGTRDIYRVGKSFRKLGFNVADVVAVLPQLQQDVENLLQEWLSLKPQVRIESDGLALDDSRRWACQLGAEQFWMFCGGTHLFNFDCIEGVAPKLEFDPEKKSISLDISASLRSIDC